MEDHAALESARRLHALQITELFVDLIYGDIVRGDAGCRRVADALVSQYEDAARWLAAGDEVASPALLSATNAYCARHVLRAAPELFVVSREATDAYTQIASVLRSTEDLAGLGAAMAEELAHLTRRPEAERFARLLEIMGDAVIAYMAKAAVELEDVSGGGDAAPPSLIAAAAQFTPAWRRRGRKRTRAMAGQGEEKEEEEEESVKAAPARGLPSELHSAMATPLRHEARRPAPRQQGQQQQEQQQRTKGVAGRALQHVNDSLHSAVGHLRASASPDRSSTLVVDRSSGTGAPRPPAPARGAVFVADERGGAQERHYFLSGETRRYEPAAVRGFYA